MTAHHFLNLVCMGTALGAFTRWAFRLDIQLHTAVSVGIIAVLFKPWLRTHFAPMLHNPDPATIVSLAAAVIAVLGVSQFVRGR